MSLGSIGAPFSHAIGKGRSLYALLAGSRAGILADRDMKEFA